MCVDVCVCDTVCVCVILCVQPIVYGLIVQLQHVKSGGYLAVSANTISDSEMNAAAVEVKRNPR